MPIRWCDDLPAMDVTPCAVFTDRASAYGEATAILAGDALQSLAFATLATAPPPTPRGGDAGRAGRRRRGRHAAAGDLAATGAAIPLPALSG